MVEVQCGLNGHTVLRCKDQLSCQSANRARRRDHDDFIESIDDVVPSQNQNRAAFVRQSKCVPTNLAAFHATFSQPPDSQASGSSSVANSTGVGGCVL